MYYKRSPSPLGMGRASRSNVCLYATLSMLCLFAFFVYTPLPTHYDTQRHALVQHVTDATVDSLSVSLRPAPHWPSLDTTNSKFAYATFVAGDDNVSEDFSKDLYFTGARTLAYQLLHAPETRTHIDAPFLALVTQHVSEAKRDRLRRDGAIVVPVEPVQAQNDWISGGVAASTWRDVMSKLRLWELTQFDRILFLDGDTILTQCLDGVFEDEAVAVQTTGSNLEQLNSDEAALPSQFVFAGTPEMLTTHHYPPGEEDWPNHDYLNAGFFVMQPSLEMLSHYMSLLELEGRFEPNCPEQNLLNYAHRREGNMPWKTLDSKWNMHYPTIDDLRGGVASLHEKWWTDVPELGPYMQHWRWRMQGFYEARDAMFAAL